MKCVPGSKCDICYDLVISLYRHHCTISHMFALTRTHMFWNNSFLTKSYRLKEVSLLMSELSCKYQEQQALTALK